jgi:general secretion pathway protein F
LHPMTAAILAISRWANDHVTFLVGSLATCVGGLFFAIRSRRSKRMVYEFSLKVPLIKTLLLHSALVRLCRSLAMLLAGGVPLLEALTLARNVVKSPLIEEAMADAQKRVGQGERLSAAFKGTSALPPLVMRMLALAEETGKMDEAFYHLAQIYDEEMEKHLSQLSTFLQPALLITLGAIVGLVVLSILLPLTDVSSFISS